MPRITSIEPQQKNHQRVNIYLDGRFGFGLSLITAGWLKVGQELSEETVADLQAEDGMEVVYQKALHFLSYRPRSAAEVRKNLVQRGTPQEIVEEIVKRLQGAGLLNDQEFARLWVENRNIFKPRGRAALNMELRRKGISDAVIRPVLDTLVDEEALAFEAARKYSRRLAGLEWQGFRQKLSGFLSRRGFSYNILSPVVSKVWQEIQTADDEGILDDKD